MFPRMYRMFRRTLNLDMANFQILVKIVYLRIKFRAHFREGSHIYFFPALKKV